MMRAILRAPSATEVELGPHRSRRRCFASDFESGPYVDALFGIEPAKMPVKTATNSLSLPMRTCGAWINKRLSCEQLCYFHTGRLFRVLSVSRTSLIPRNLLLHLDGIFRGARRCRGFSAKLHHGVCLSRVISRKNLNYY